jgi:UDP-glucose 4-epimerase
LLNAGHQVTVFDNLSEGHRVAVDERAQFIEGCLSDRETILNAVAADQSEAVMHFAAFAQVGESMTDPSKYFRNNVANGINLLDAAVEAGVKKFVFSSTAATYGMPDSVPITEQGPQKPINPYGESKLMFETILKWYRELHGLEFVAFRYFNAAGCSEKLGEERRVETHLIPNVLRVALGQKKECRIFGTDYPTPDGTCIRDYIHVNDLGAAHIDAVEYLLHGGESNIFNLGYGYGYSVKEVVDTAKKVTGINFKTVETGRRAGDPPALTANSTKIKETLKWSPKYNDLEFIIKTAWEWEKKL